MDMLWKKLYEWALSLSMTPTWAKVAASAATAALLLIAALAVAAALSGTARRFIVKKSDRGSNLAKTATLIRSGSWLVFIWILYAHLPGALRLPRSFGAPLERILCIGTIILSAATVSSALTWLRSAAGERTMGNNIFSSKTVSQTAKIILWLTAAIVTVSAIMGKSPTFVLSGLGALTAVLMLIFRDSLLGLVAGVQVSQNDMVRIGDWITMPKYNADGNVIDIALTTVKVQNFDNTVTMIPSSALISDSFVNWRYMSMSKGRRIKRPVWVSAMSIRELSPDDREKLIAAKLLCPEDKPVSNLAAFEIWLRRMLENDENISRELTCMVRQTPAGDTGIPVEVYAFTKTRDWVEYENIQTEIFDRIFVTVPKFGLQIYQRTGDKQA